MITKKFGIDFDSVGGALTLSSGEVTDGMVESGHYYQKEHDDGWIISAIAYEDYYEWVNDFKAVHPIYGKVWGDFEEEVFADSEEGYKHFYENHTPDAWDYYDI